MPKPSPSSPSAPTVGLPPGVDETQLRQDLMEYQSLQQQLQLAAMQRQQAAFQLAELEKAEGEVTGASGTLYRSTGSLLIPKAKDVLLKELGEEKETLTLRASTMLKQEDKLKERFNALRKKLESLQREG